MDDEQRWQRLFTDLEHELSGLADDERIAESVARARAESGRCTFAERVVASRGSRVRVGLPGERVEGILVDAGPDWALVCDRHTHLVNLDACGWIDGLLLPAGAPPLPSGVAGRFDLRMAARRLARERTPVVISLCDSSSHAGTIDRVGADHLELAVHAVDEVRRAEAVRAIRCVALRAVASVRFAVSP